MKTILWVFCSFFALASMPDDMPNEFEGTYDECLREARKQNKAIVLHFWASWCPPCNKQRRVTFTNEDLNNYMEGRYFIFLVDVNTADGRAIARRFDVELYPSIVVINKNAQKRKQFTGLTSPKYMKKQLKWLRF